LFAASLTFASMAAATLPLTGCAIAPPDDCSAKATCASSGGEGGGSGASAAKGASAASGGGELLPTDASVPTDAVMYGQASHQALDAGPRAAADGWIAGDVGPGRDDGSQPTMAASCPSGYECAEPGPQGWLWGLAVWESEADDAFPPCPPNYDRPFDMHGGLNAAAAVCTTDCVASGQTCSPALSIFSDTGCRSACATQANVPSAACTAVSGCGETQGTLRAEAPAPSGGACVARVSATVPPTSWSSVARMCINNAPAPGTCSNPLAQCIPSPGAPFSTHLCIGQIPAPGEPIPTTCPSTYPNGPTVYYRSVNGTVDNRGCSPATCSGAAPVGGNCAGTIAVTGALADDCTTGAFTYLIGSGCSAPFRLAAPLSHAQASYTVTPGSCSVGTPSVPVGSAKPSGSPNVLCCK
jgi:hypothetical protein